MTYQWIIVEKTYEEHIGLITLNRPKELNALHRELMLEVMNALKDMDEDPSIRVIILTGGPKVFAAGADIKQMAGAGAIDMLQIDQFSTWDQIRRTRKPIIAAVAGFALGGGCELAMTCDMIVASEQAQFGQPEIKIGTMPGAGGTQRLPRIVGKALAMEMALTGVFIPARRLFERGLINRIVPGELLLEETLRLAREVAKMSPVAVALAKESVLKSFDTSLTEGLLYERKNFYLTFASDDQKEGMQAFVEKRPPVFKGR